MLRSLLENELRSGRNQLNVIAESNHLNDYEPYFPEQEIAKSIDNQTDRVTEVLQRKVELHEKELNNHSIAIEQLNDLVNEIRENGKVSSAEARKSHWISIVSIIAAFASLLVSVLKIVIK